MFQRMIFSSRKVLLEHQGPCFLIVLFLAWLSTCLCLQIRWTWYYYDRKCLGKDLEILARDCVKAWFVFREAMSECRILKKHAKTRPQISRHVHWDLVNHTCVILAALLVFLKSDKHSGSSEKNKPSLTYKPFVGDFSWSISCFSSQFVAAFI